MKITSLFRLAKSAASTASDEVSSMRGSSTRSGAACCALLLTTFSASASAKDPAPPKSELPYDVRVAKVVKGKLPAFYDPKHLNRSPALSAASAILIDADTGQTLWEKNASVPRAPASTTKILTALLFIENTTPDEIVRCSDQNITKIEESSLHIKPGERFRAEQLLYGMLLRSGNDAAVLMAQHVGGSTAGFAEMMNQRGRELGAADSHWVTPNGLNNPNHYSTAADLARIARAAMRNPRFVEAVRLPRRTIERSINKGDRTIIARGSRQFFNKFPGADGIKSGYTRQAKRCYVGSATREGRRLLSVVLGCEGGAIADTLALQGWGFRRFSRYVVVAQNGSAGSIVVPNAASGVVPTVVARDLQVSADSTLPAPQITTELMPLADLAAPLARGQQVGVVVAKLNGVTLAQAPLLAAEDVAVAPASVIAARRITGAVGGKSGGSPFGGWLVSSIGAGVLFLVAWRYANRIRYTRKRPATKTDRTPKTARVR